ncbi:hypothetical protein NUSPORA_00285 [Nucleospora cyclopteri]
MAEFIDPNTSDDCHFCYEPNGDLNDLGRNYSQYGQQAHNDPSKTLGVVILSGGEGSRLDCTGPKGLFELVNGINLFNIHLEKLKNLKKKTLAKIILFIMTSFTTHEAVVTFFNDFFKDHPITEYCDQYEIFQQGLLPILSARKRPMRGFSSPDGNGGLYEAIKKTDSYGKTDYFNVISVDNVAATFFDEPFLGCLLQKEYEILNKTVNPMENEKVGGFTFYKDKSIRIVEYSEISEEVDINWVQGNICNHLITRVFMDSVTEEDLTIHHAKKKPKEGMRVPKGEQIIKQEKFIFDPFKKSKKMGVFNVLRNSEFIPLKSKEDIESCKEYCKEFCKLHKKGKKRRSKK